MSKSLVSNAKKLIEKFYKGSFRSAFAYGSASAITQIMMMVYLLLIANWLGAAQYGYIAAAYAATSISAFIFNWGLNEWMMKTGATDKKPELLTGNVIILKTLLGIVWGIGLYCSLPFIRPELYFRNVLLLSLLDVWLDGIFGTLLIIFLLTDRVKHGSMLLIASRLIRLLTGLGIIFLGSKSILLVLVLRTACSLMAVIISWIFAKPVFRLSKPGQLWVLFKDSIAFNISELLNLIYIYADVNILSILGASPALIGNYSIAINLINAIILLPSGVYNVLLPTFIRNYQNQKALFFKKIKYLFISFVLTGLILWVGATFLSNPVIITLLGDDYKSSAAMLIWLSPLLAIKTFNQANIAYLITVGWQVKRLVPQLVSVGIKILIGFLLVVHLGVQGMVISTIVSEIILASIHLFQVLKHRLEQTNKVFLQ